MDFRILVVLPIFFALPYSVKAELLYACKLDQDYAPHSFPDREAPGEHLIKMAVESIGDQVQFYPSPWPRCLEGIKSGEYDLIVGPSPDPKFFSYIVYPFIEGVPDPTQSLGPVDYMVLRKKGSDIEWDGHAFKRLKTPVFYSDKAVIIRSRLDEMGVASDDSVLDLKQLIDMLFHDRTDAVIVRRYEALEQIALAPYKDSVEMLEVPLVSFNSHLGLSRQRYEKDPKRAAQMWAEIRRIRQTDVWESMMRGLLDDHR